MFHYMKWHNLLRHFLVDSYFVSYFHLLILLCKSLYCETLALYSH